ncbi:hypothetical protein BDK51DRAFT_12167, partial [Blyttiomyces helicus]
EFKLDNVARLPCTLQSTLQGVAGGTIVGAVRYFATGRYVSAGNWGFSSFAGIAMISWEFCRYQRRIVQQQMDQISKEQSLR